MDTRINLIFSLVSSRVALLLKFYSLLVLWSYSKEYSFDGYWIPAGATRLKKQEGSGQKWIKWSVWKRTLRAMQIAKSKRTQNVCETQTDMSLRSSFENAIKFCIKFADLKKMHLPLIIWKSQPHNHATTQFRLYLKNWHRRNDRRR